MGAVPIQASDFCKQTCKINIKIAWKNSQCEYAKIYHFRTENNHSLEKIANVNEPLKMSPHLYILSLHLSANFGV